MDTKRLIEALLFWRGEPMSKGSIADALSCDLKDVEKALITLRETLSDRGITLLETADSVALTTAPAASTLIERLTREELSKDLGKAGLEALSVIVYQGPINKSDIDYIRGVNSHYILRSLMVRGLIERVTDPNDQRSYQYRATPELLALLGVTTLQSLPEFERLKTEMESFREIQ